MIQRSSAHRRVPKTRLEPHVPRLKAPRLVSVLAGKVHGTAVAPGEQAVSHDPTAGGPVQQQLKPGALEPLPVSLSAKVKSPRRLDAGSFGAWEESFELLEAQRSFRIPSAGQRAHVI